MRIGIIGNGFVGRATCIFAKNYFTNDTLATETFEVLPDTVTTPAKTNSVRTYNGDGRPTPDGGFLPPFFKRLLFKQIELYIYDIRPELCHPVGITLQELDNKCDLLFFCLPTPLNHDGTCYTKILEDTIARCSNPYKIIRSTIPVGFAAKHGCYFMPEFLTEASWENDFRRMKEWIVGIPSESDETPTPTPTPTPNHEEFKRRIRKLIKRSYKNGSIDSHTIVFCKTNEAELLKLMKNCFLSAKVGIMNELYDFSQATNTDFREVVKFAKLDARMGTSHFQVPGPDGRRGFGGTCFPKDTHSLYCQMNAYGVRSYIYPAILTRNDTIDRPEREWSKDVWRTTIPLPTPTSKVVVVFNDTASITPSSTSNYLADVIFTNLSKNNIVIEVSRNLLEHNVLHSKHPAAATNHIVKYFDRNHPSVPLFFPRVDECYYIPHSTHSVYETTQEVLRVIDLWNHHQEMTLYVIKSSRYNYDRDGDGDGDGVSDSESGTEGFSSECEGNSGYNGCDRDAYAISIIQDYFSRVLSVLPNHKRGLVVLF